LACFSKYSKGVSLASPKTRTASKNQEQISNTIRLPNSRVYLRLLIDTRIEEKKGKKTTQAAKSSSHQLRKRSHLGRKAPSPEEKKAVSEEQEGCGQTSQQTTPV